MLNAYLIVFSLEQTLTFLLGGGLPLNLIHTTEHTVRQREKDDGWFHITDSHEFEQNTTDLAADKQRVKSFLL